MLNAKVVLISLALMLTPVISHADAALAKAKNCMSCHAVNSAIVGPSFVDVSRKYAGQADASSRLVSAIVNGGRGTWGATPMPANPQVSEDEAARLVRWILAAR